MTVTKSDVEEFEMRMSKYHGGCEDDWEAAIALAVAELKNMAGVKEVLE